MRCGTSPPKRSHSAWPRPMSEVVLLRKKPVGRISVLELGPVRRRVVGGGAVAGEQRRRDLVHPLVGALRGQDRRDDQLERVGEVELAVRVGVQRRRAPVDPPGPAHERRAWSRRSGSGRSGPSPSAVPPAQRTCRVTSRPVRAVAPGPFDRTGDLLLNPATDSDDPHCKGIRIERERRCMVTGRTTEGGRVHPAGARAQAGVLAPDPRRAARLPPGADGRGGPGVVLAAAHPGPAGRGRGRRRAAATRPRTSGSGRCSPRPASASRQALVSMVPVDDVPPLPDLEALWSRELPPVRPAGTPPGCGATWPTPSCSCRRTGPPCTASCRRRPRSSSRATARTRTLALSALPLVREPDPLTPAAPRCCAAGRRTADCPRVDRRGARHSAPLFAALDDEAAAALRASMADVDLPRGDVAVPRGRPGRPALRDRRRQDQARRHLRRRPRDAAGDPRPRRDVRRALPLRPRTAHRDRDRADRRARCSASATTTCSRG